LGARAGYIGSLGDRDPLSRTVRRRFDREGIDLSHCVARPDARPYHSTIIVGRRPPTRTIFSSNEGHAGADPQLPAADVIRSTAVLLIDHHAIEGTRRAVEIARAAGVEVVADFERDSGKGFCELLARVDHLVLPERFAVEWTGTGSAERAVSRLWSPDRRAVVVTCGADGCWYGDSETHESPRHLPAPKVNVVDTTGCGDVFHGAYCAGLAEGKNVDQCVRLASAAAALKATREGGQAGIPRRDVVEQFLAGWK